MIYGWSFFLFELWINCVLCYNILFFVFYLGSMLFWRKFLENEMWFLFYLVLCGWLLGLFVLYLGVVGWGIVLWLIMIFIRFWMKRVWVEFFCFWVIILLFCFYFCVFIRLGIWMICDFFCLFLFFMIISCWVYCNEICNGLEVICWCVEGYLIIL